MSEPFRQVFEEAGDAIYLHDLQGRILEVNAEACRQLGYTRDQLLNLSFQEIHSSNATPLPPEQLERLGRGETVVVETTQIRTDHSLMDVEVKSRLSEFKGSPAVISIARDITVRKSIESALRKSEERYRSLVNNMGEGIALVDETECFRFANPAAERIFGVAPGALAGRCLSEFIGETDTYQAILEQTNRRRRGEESTYECRIRRPDGTKRTIRVTATPQFDSDGRYQGAFGLFWDATEQEEIQRNLQKAHDELELRVKERTEALSRAVADLSASREQLRALASHMDGLREEENRRIAREIHDELGQAITAARFELTFMRKELSLSDPATERIGRIEEILKNMLEEVRRIAHNLRPAVLDDLGLRGAVEWLASDFNGRTGIETTVELDKVPEESADYPCSTTVFRILQESLTNVARHSGASQVTIDLRLTEGTLCLEVTDDGAGIDLDRVSPQSFGLLGMKERALRWGGDLSVCRCGNTGTRVSLQIPVSGQ